MTFKEKAVEALTKAAQAEMGPAMNIIRECAELVAQLPDEERKNVPCAAPDYEALYHEAMKKLQEAEFTRENMRDEIKQLHFVNSRLTGFREAVELIFQKDCDCHGRG